MFRNQLETHEQAIKNLRADLDLSQQEVKNTLRENAELREALKTARSQSRPASAMVSAETVITRILRIICNMLHVTCFNYALLFGDHILSKRICVRIFCILLVHEENKVVPRLYVLIYLIDILYVPRGIFIVNKLLTIIEQINHFIIKCSIRRE